MIINLEYYLRYEGVKGRTTMKQSGQFDITVSRKGTGASKWDQIPYRDEENWFSPLTVADMEVAVCDKIRNALEKRLAHGIFGYTKPDWRFYESVCSFLKKNHRLEVTRDMLVFTTSVIPAILAGIYTCTNEADGVIVFSPAYTGFYNSISQAGRKVAECPLLLQDDTYEIDFNKFRSMAKDDANKLVILCNPHNPVGRVWTKDELKEILSICQAEGLYLISDEIHWDVILEGKHTSVGEVIPKGYEDCVIVCSAPTKTFNLAGLLIAYSIVFDDGLRKKFQEQLLRMGQGEALSVFGYEATMAAYDQGEEWLEHLIDYIQGNMCLLRTWLEENVPEIRMIHTEGTYLAWLDCRKVRMGFQVWLDTLREEGIYFTDGMYFGKDGEGFVRVNLAISKDELNRILANWKKLISRK